MGVTNAQIADIFDELADLLDIEGANAFRIRAYRNAARNIRGEPRDMAERVAAGEDLSKLPGIGKDLAGKIQTIVETGRLPLLDQMAARTPRVLVDLLAVEGLGPKRVRALYSALSIRSAEDLIRAADAGRIRGLPGFGAKLERTIREGVERLDHLAGRMRLDVADELAAPIVEYLRRVRGVKQVAVAGSLRRRRETIGDLDLLVTAKRDSPVMQRFVEYADVEEVISQGATRASVRLHAGLNVDLRVVPEVSFGAALHYFTGSKAHNIAVRSRAVARGLKLNEYGVYRGERRIAGRTEEEVFAAVGLAYVPPELRESVGEIEAAEKDRLPDLIGLGDIRGDLHCHSTASDGRATIAEMARAARDLGYEYLSINDHSRRVTVAHGLDRKRLLRQIRDIDRLNERLDGVRVLKSVELEILKDGSLDLPDAVLDELDFTVCAVHFPLGLSAERQTERILRAMDNPRFSILAHPTGRLINERVPYAVDMQRLIEGAAERGCVLELNASPQRLDLAAETARHARDCGVNISIGSDAHSTAGLGDMRFGVDQARRAWLSPADVINTRPLTGLMKILGRK